jgi:hypothetical protein
MGQKISTCPIDKAKQDQARWSLLMFMIKLNVVHVTGPWTITS